MLSRCLGMAGTTLGGSLASGAQSAVSGMFRASGRRATSLQVLAWQLPNLFAGDQQARNAASIKAKMAEANKALVSCVAVAMQLLACRHPAVLAPLP